MAPNEEAALAKIEGLLDIFSIFNFYTNSVPTFTFEEIPFKGTLESSLNEHVEPHAIDEPKTFHYKIMLEEISNDIYLLTNSFGQWLLPEFSENYKGMSEYARNECAGTFTNTIKGFFRDAPLKIYEMTLDVVGNPLEAPWYEATYKDYVFLCNDRIFLLHFGISD